MDQKKWRWSIQWMNLNHRDQLQGKDFPNFELLDSRMASTLRTRSSRIPTSKRRSIWRKRKLRQKIGFFEEDRLLTWFTTTFESLELMMPFLIRRIYSLSLFAWRQCSGLRDEVGWNSIVWWPRLHRMMFWKVCTNWENVSLVNSKLYYNCTTWKLIRRCRCLIIRKMKTMVKRSIDQKLRLRNFDARN